MSTKRNQPSGLLGWFVVRHGAAAECRFVDRGFAIACVDDATPAAACVAYYELAGS
ncbi:MAG: hypothetical protein RDV41_08300 [Planctomycetota bacterium]|nr:hypothetical protein [Planctomycetota bacterium]